MERLVRQVTVLLIIFVLSDLGRWEFSNIEPISSPVPSYSLARCEMLALGVRDSMTRAFCVEDSGVEI